MFVHAWPIVLDVVISSKVSIFIRVQIFIVKGTLFTQIRRTAATNFHLPLPFAYTHLPRLEQIHHKRAEGEISSAMSLPPERGRASE
ncbi:MAG: hypothetical protein LBR71_03605, partial [Synergistaceae bacterium]|nr:hypothetical protein [Synergistaceae bacterium]